MTVPLESIKTSLFANELQLINEAITPFYGEFHHISQNPGLRDTTLVQWSTAHLPKTLQLPKELKILLMSTNGFEAIWHAQINNHCVDIGCIRIFSLDRMVKPHFQLGKDRPSEHMILIDAEDDVGQTALLYNRVCHEQPQVWFCGLDGEWVYLCDSFTNYLRLMILHLGIRGWQYAFTRIGLDPTTSYWLGLFAPERLEIDMTKFEFEDVSHMHESAGSVPDLRVLDEKRVKRIERAKLPRRRSSQVTGART